MAGYDINQKPGETLERYYRRLAKTADQRLVRLEKYEKETYFKTATLWAYARAKKDIEKWTPKNAKVTEYRFNIKPPEKTEDLLAKINDIKTFLSSPTSTKKGITEVYKKRAETFNKKFETQFTWQQLAKYYESGINEIWDAKFGSDTALRTIGQIQKHADQIKKAIADNDIKNIKVDNSQLTVEVKKALRNNNLNIMDMLG